MNCIIIVISNVADKDFVIGGRVTVEVGKLAFGLLPFGLLVLGLGFDDLREPLAAEADVDADGDDHCNEQIPSRHVEDGSRDSVSSGLPDTGTDLTQSYREQVFQGRDDGVDLAELAD